MHTVYPTSSIQGVFIKWLLLCEWLFFLSALILKSFLYDVKYKFSKTSYLRKFWFPRKLKTTWLRLLRLRSNEKRSFYSKSFSFLFRFWSVNTTCLRQIHNAFVENLSNRLKCHAIQILRMKTNGKTRRMADVTIVLVNSNVQGMFRYLFYNFIPFLSSKSLLCPTQCNIVLKNIIRTFANTFKQVSAGFYNLYTNVSFASM